MGCVSRTISRAPIFGTAMFRSIKHGSRLENVSRGRQHVQPPSRGTFRHMRMLTQTDKQKHSRPTLQCSGDIRKKAFSHTCITWNPSWTLGPLSLRYGQRCFQTDISDEVFGHPRFVFKIPWVRKQPRTMYPASARDCHAETTLSRYWVTQEAKVGLQLQDMAALPP
jgi:hypothetical protein